jgi:hypothetical protein
MPLLKKGTRCVPLLGLPTSGLFFRLAGPFITRCPGGPTESIAFWSKFSSVDINRDFAACLLFLPTGLTSALTDQGPYEFAVSGAGDDYIDLANIYLFVEAQIMDDDDTALDGGLDVGSVTILSAPNTHRPHWSV